MHLAELNRVGLQLHLQTLHLPLGRLALDQHRLLLGAGEKSFSRRAVGDLVEQLEGAHAGLESLTTRRVGVVGVS